MPTHTFYSPTIWDYLIYVPDVLNDITLNEFKTPTEGKKEKQQREAVMIFHPLLLKNLKQDL